MLNVKLLARTLGRMESSYDNETLVAARAAVRMVREARADWDTLLGSSDSEVAPSNDPIGAAQVLEHPERGPIAPPVGRTWVATLNWLCARNAGATPRENTFLDNLNRRLSSQNSAALSPWITPVQGAWVVDIYERVAAGGPEGEWR